MTEAKQSFLGIELGSTRIKAVLTDEACQPLSKGEFTWKSRLEDGFWTYDLKEVWTGLRHALSQMTGLQNVSAVAVSAMMHGHFAFDRDWNLLVPFRTWQNTASQQATELMLKQLDCHIPQRYCISQLVQAILNEEPHVKHIAHITTLSGYVHYMLTGEFVVGLGDASGIFPVDEGTLDYDAHLLQALEEALASYELPWHLRDLFPRILKAGETAGYLTEAGAERIHACLPAGVPFSPPEGDALTGMVATNSISEGCGCVSAGTSIFFVTVPNVPFSKREREINALMTPDGKSVAMVSAINCTADINAWVAMLGEVLALFGVSVPASELFSALFEKSLTAQTDCDGIINYNYLAGEGIFGIDSGRPLLLRQPNSCLSLANFMRAQIYGCIATLKIGMDLLFSQGITVSTVTAHGGLFKTPLVAQRYLASALNIPVDCLEGISEEGGAYGSALLAAYLRLRGKNESLDDFLNKRIFSDVRHTTVEPNEEDVKGFEQYIKQYRKGLAVEKLAAETV